MIKKSIALLFVVAVCLEKARAATILADSEFATDADGWTYMTQTATVGAVTWNNGAITVSDTGSSLWWFSAPAKFTGVQTAAYNGMLTFTLSPTASDNAGKPPIAAADVILVSECGYELRLSSVLTPGVSKTYTVIMNEDGWIDSRTQRPPNVYDFLGVLNNLAGLYIRGSFYVGAETTMLDAVTLSAGTLWYPCCTILGDVEMCSKPGSPYFNPTNLKFYCEGSQKKRITVNSISPRFSRRTGGQYITVTGTNFGLAGSTPIVRIGGRPCQKSFYTQAAADILPPPNKGPPQQTQIVCLTAPGEGSNLPVTVEAASGPTDSPFNVRMGRNQRGWEYHETTSESCIGDNNRGFAFGGYEYAWTAQIEENVLHPCVATDVSTGDVYVAGSVSGTTSQHNLLTHMGGPQVQTYFTCGGSLTYCGFVAKFSRDGTFQWVSVVDATSASSGAGAQILISDIGFDNTMDKGGRVYITGTITQGSVTFYPELVTVVRGSAAVFPVQPSGVTPTAVVGTQVQANTGTAAKAMFIGQIDGSGTPKWFNVVFRCLANEYACSLVHQKATTSDTTETFDANPRLAIYRPALSDIINQETQGNNPSVDYILGTPRDNGGVYIAGTITSPASQTTLAKRYSVFSPGINIAYARASPVAGAGDYVELGSVYYADVNNAYSIGYLVKYDCDGNAQWVRTFGTSTSQVDNSAQPVTPSVTSIVAYNDAIFVGGTATIAAGASSSTNIAYDSCAWSTTKAGAGSVNVGCYSSTGANTVENRPQSLSAIPELVNYDPTFSVKSTASLVTPGGVSVTVPFIVAYSNAGLVSWHVEVVNDAAPLNTGFAFNLRAMAFIRPIVGGQPLTGNIDGSGYTGMSLAGRNQVSSETTASSFYLYAVGTFVSSGSASAIHVLGKSLLFNLGNTNPYVFIFKLNAMTGTASWVTYNGGSTDSLFFSPSSYMSAAADSHTGHLFVVSSGFSATGMSSCVGATDCGSDTFEMMSVHPNRPGCMVDARASGVANSAIGLPRCKFIGHTDGGQTGYIFSISDEITDVRGAVIASIPADLANGAAATARPSVRWVKTFGVATTGTSMAADIAISDSALYVVGTFTGPISLVFPNTGMPVPPMTPDTYTGTAGTVLAKLQE